MAEFAESLIAPLGELDIDVAIDEVDWIPNETGWSVDRKVSKRLKESIRGFDLVHAWGMRTAWACGEAFYLRFPWVYTAFDMPKTSNNQLVDRLNSARTGICCCSAARQFLDGAYTSHLKTIYPGLPPYLRFDRETAREQLGFGPEEFLVLSLSSDHMDDVVHEITNQRADVSFAIFSDEETPGADKIESREQLPLWIAASDLVIQSKPGLGIDLDCLLAMSSGVPVMAKDVGGLSEMGVANVSLEVYEDENDLTRHLLELIDAPVHREALGLAGRAKVEDRFNIQECAEKYAAVYRSVLNP
ncbi:MAG: glycosyltransferase family 4 protein [Armatimonadetes bacterium]|nr:glycosyltransferase family 4 protein [Armatimonadota bacterium]